MGEVLSEEGPLSPDIFHRYCQNRYVYFAGVWHAGMNRNQPFLLFLIASLSILVFVVILPFAQYIIAACILAYVIFPYHRRLALRTGPVASAVLLLFGSLIAVILPVMYILVVFIQSLSAIAAGESGLDIAAIEARLAELTGEEVDVAAWLGTAANQTVEVLFGGTNQIIAGTFKAGLGLFLVLFLGYYILLEGPAFIDWVRDLIPLPDRVTDELFAKVDATMWGVVIAEIIVAIAQALLGGVALWITGIPNVVFWTFVMAIFALIPLVGSFVVWGPASMYLVIIDQTTAGVFLAIWGVTVVSLFDNYARPILIDQRAKINPGVIFVGVLGGVYAIGFTGLFVGPILIAVLASVLELYRTEFSSV